MLRDLVYLAALFVALGCAVAMVFVGWQDLAIALCVAALAVGYVTQPDDPDDPTPLPRRRDTL